jgi:phosphotriesterase-related protein
LKNLDLVGKVQTVLGLIDGSELGITLPHEHLIIDASDNFIEPTDLIEKAVVHQPVTLENIGWLRYNPRINIDVLSMLDEERLVKELLIYKAYGGNSIVDCTPKDLHRDPDAAVRISKVTDINIIFGTGYYKSEIQSSRIDNMSEEEIADEIVREILEGIGPNKVRAGIIGEIGISSSPLTSNESKVLRATAKAQKRTGVLISVHPGYHEDSSLEIVTLLKNLGADIRHTVICHVDMSVRKPTTRRRLAESGCFIEYDHIGREEYYHAHAWTEDLPDDLRRLDEIIELIDLGYLGQILLSHDVGNKTNRSSFGGCGYEHLLRDFVPLMRRRGISEADIHTMLVDNPRRALSFT